MSSTLYRKDETLLPRRSASLWSAVARASRPRFVAKAAAYPTLLHCRKEKSIQRSILESTVVTDLAKILILLGVILLLAGFFLLFLGRTNFPLGRLPGDILYRGKNTTFYFPLATSILLSVVLSVVLYLIGKWRQ